MNSKQLIFLYILITVVKISASYLLINPVYELHRDEYLHLDQANRLAWGYMSVPPVTSWIAWLIKAFGGGKFWVLFFPALAGSFTIIAAIEIVREAGGKSYSMILAAVALLFSALLRLNQLFQPNSIDVLAWTLTFYFVIKYLKSRKVAHLYYFGLVIGFGFLNKYNIIFLCAGLGLALILTPLRRVLAEKHFYLSLLVALLVAAPNLHWQYTNGWPVFKHMNELHDTQLVHVKPIDFLKDQFLFFVNSIFVWIPGLIALLFYKPFKAYRLIGLSYIFVIVIFLALKAKSYYAIGLYPVLIAFGAVYLEKVIESDRLNKFRLLLPVISVGLFLPILSLAFPVNTPEQIKRQNSKLKGLGLLRWEDGKDHDIPQDFADMIGWKEMTKKVEKAYLSIPVGERKETVIICGNYGEAGAINYYSNGTLPQAVAFSADYIRWFPSLKGVKHFIVVGEKSSEEDIAQFKLFKKIGEVTTPFAREKGTGIFVLSYPNTAIIRALENRIEENK